MQPIAATLVSVLAYSGPRPEEALRLTWADIGTEAIHYDGRKTRRPRWTPLLPQLAADLREWRLASGRPSGGPVFPAHDGAHWQPDDWRNWRRRTWQKIAPPGTRPRDLRGSYVTLRVYERMPLTEIARHVGTSIAMLDRHYAGVIANWDGERAPQASRSGGLERPSTAGGGRSLTCVGRNLVYVWCASGRRVRTA